MISFKNPQNIDVFESFFGEFEEVNDIFNDDIEILGINEQHILFSAVATKDDPFATNTSIKPVCIAINEQICQKLDLTQKEQYAMIAHEIGHILDSSPREENNQLGREFNADLFAVKLGLSKELKTGLEKIVASGNYIAEDDCLNKRIKEIVYSN